MSNKIRSISIGICLVFLWGFRLEAQDCRFSLRGQVLDESRGTPLEYANLFLQEVNQGVPSDRAGMFEFSNLCPGPYHIQISHLGCENQRLYILLTRDSFLTIRLHHHTEVLNEIEVHGSHEQTFVQASQSINRDQLVKNAHKNLADQLESITGVYILKNGAGISKPVIHGMYGNRVGIYNQGVLQAGQQWGNDHAPEIDAFMADHITVIKGSSSLAFGGNGLGSLVLVQAGAIDDDPHWHGMANLIYQTNGRGLTSNLRLQKSKNDWAWRLSGTLKRIGDQHTPDYYLTNTGRQEGNLGLELNHTFSSRWNSKLYFSSFYNHLGILRGSHIGNSTDLQTAFTREPPFFTQPSFSNRIEAPSQKVNHYFAKLENKFQASDHRIWNFNYSFQANQRKEFDVRRSGRTEIPALYLIQYSHLVESTMHYEASADQHIKAGIQTQLTDNTNQPETGILPLIPDYIAWRPGAYLIYEKIKSRYMIEAGMRTDWNYLQVAAISRDLPRRIQHFDHSFLNINFSAGLKWMPSEPVQLSFNTGWAMRAPEVNELYSNGLHQGVSGIEEGIHTLQTEKSWKSILSLDYRPLPGLFFQSQLYLHFIEDYIFLQPQNETRLTIRGAFPVFKYSQTRARLMGIDFLHSHEWNEHWRHQIRYASIWGRDILQQQGLIFIPPPSFFFQLDHLVVETPRFKNNSISLSGRSVFRQTQVADDQDFLPSPPAYFLLGAELNTRIQWGAVPITWTLSAENLLNARYRDYLNRLRYFADEPGRNLVMRMTIRF
jgi:iron complex outermembrane recepter protein